MIFSDFLKKIEFYTESKECAEFIGRQIIRKYYRKRSICVRPILVHPCSKGAKKHIPFSIGGLFTFSKLPLIGPIDSRRDWTLLHNLIMRDSAQTLKNFKERHPLLDPGMVQRNPARVMFGGAAVPGMPAPHTFITGETREAEDE